MSVARMVTITKRVSSILSLSQIFERIPLFTSSFVVPTDCRHVAFFETAFLAQARYRQISFNRFGPARLFNTTVLSVHTPLMLTETVNFSLPALKSGFLSNRGIATSLELAIFCFIITARCTTIFFLITYIYFSRDEVDI